MSSRLVPIILCVVFSSMNLTNITSAAPGGNGNGGGKPGGGEDPPPPPLQLPVKYTITAPEMPHAKFYFNDHNESGAAVGWNLGGDAPDAARPVVYLPDVDPSQAFYLDQLPSFPGMPAAYIDWHPSSAVAINKHGDIGGNVQLYNDINKSSQASLYLRSTGSPQMMVLDLQDPDAEREFVSALNDSGDALIVSQKTVNGEGVPSLFVGNIYDDPTSFQKLEASAFVPYNATFSGGLHLSNRIDGGPAILATRLTNDITGERDVVRVAIDGSSLELLDAGTTNDGGYYEGFWLDSIHDINDAGDVSGPGKATSKPGGKGKANLFAARWAADTGLIDSLGNSNALTSPYYSAYLNNSGDYLVEDDRQAAFLWHSVFSQDNGLIPLTDAFDPADLNEISFTHSYELTDHGTTGWPTIFARGIEVVDDISHNRLLILTPESVSSASSVSTAVPEPQTATLIACALLGTLLRRRGRGGKHLG